MVVQAGFQKTYEKFYTKEISLNTGFLDSSSGMKAKYPWYLFSNSCAAFKAKIIGKNFSWIPMNWKGDWSRGGKVIVFQKQSTLA